MARLCLRLRSELINRDNYCDCCCYLTRNQWQQERHIQGVCVAARTGFGVFIVAKLSGLFRQMVCDASCVQNCSRWTSLEPSLCNAGINWSRHGSSFCFWTTPSAQSTEPQPNSQALSAGQVNGQRSFSFPSSSDRPVPWALQVMALSQLHSPTSIMAGCQWRRVVCAWWSPHSSTHTAHAFPQHPPPQALEVSLGKALT